MLDFTVPNSPGRGERVLEEQGSDEGHSGAISPTMLAAIEAISQTPALFDEIREGLGTSGMSLEGMVAEMRKIRQDSDYEGDACGR